MALFDTIYKFLGRSRIGFSSLVMIFALVNPVFAQETVPEENFEDPYLVQNIEADAYANSAVEAREKAFEAAQIAGYEELAKRFLSEEELAAFEVPSIDVVAQYVQDFEVTNEKLSATRYIGTYDIRFAENTFLKPNTDELNNEAAFPQQTQLLILPFLEVNRRYYLWQINPFWEAWKRAQMNNVLGKIIVPIGSRDDVMSIRDGQKLQYNASSLNSMQLRYQASQVAIVIASPEPLPDNTLNVAIGLYDPKPYGPKLFKQLSVRSYPGEDTDQLYNRVVATITQAFHAQWSREMPAPQVQNQPEANTNIFERENDPPLPSLTGVDNNIIAQFQFSNVRDWVEMKQAIEQINGVDVVQIKSLSSNSATIGIQFKGEVEGLRAALGQQGIRLNDAPAGAIYQIIRSRG